MKQDGIERFLDIVGVACTISYFQIAYCLQCEVAKQLNFTKLHFYTDAQLINITIGLAFGMTNLINFPKNSQKQIWDSSKFDFDTFIEQLESEIKLYIIDDCSNQTDLNPQQIKTVANYLYSTQLFDEAVEFYKQLLNVCESKSIDKSGDYDVAWANNHIGYCLLELNKPDQALSYLRRFLEIEENGGWRQLIPTTLHNIGWCHFDLHNYDKALTNLNRALEITQNTTLNADTDRDVANTLHNIGRCHIDLHNYDEALTNLNRALEIQQNTTLNADTDRTVAIMLHTIGWCHIGLHNYDEALTNLNRALEIYQNSSLDVDKNHDLAATQRAIGRCLTGLQQYDDSWSRLQRSLKIFQNTTPDQRKDIGIARTWANVR